MSTRKGGSRARHVSIHAPARGATRSSRASCRTWSGFQSTPPRGGRLETPPAAAERLFQSTPPRGGRLCIKQIRAHNHRVSIHAPARGRRRINLASSGPIISFNPRPRAGGDVKNTVAQTLKSFNPRPRAGGDVQRSRHWKLTCVSIHAPARGATSTIELSRVRQRVSIHAPARGATDGLDARCHPGGVSIHAPARGATGALVSQQSVVDCFNPHPRAGGRPTRPHLCTRQVSIHAPARGATLKGRGPVMRKRVSIHAPARGATSPLCASIGMRMFQSTPPRGGRPSTPRGPLLALVSIHAPARGATRRDSLSVIFRYVSIHAPARGATFCLRTFL